MCLRPRPRCCYNSTRRCGKNHAIAHASRTLNQAEVNYSVAHQETLAIVWALKHFRDIMLGYLITVFRDHAPVTEVFKGRNLTGGLARWFRTLGQPLSIYQVAPTSSSIHSLEMYLLASWRKCPHKLRMSRYRIWQHLSVSMTSGTKSY